MTGLSTLLVSVTLLLAGSCTPLYDKLGGDFSGGPDQLEIEASPRAIELIRRAYADVDPSRLVDFHVHVLGLGAGGTGAYINPDMRKVWRPLKYLRTKVYMSAAGVRNDSNADADYMTRLHALIDHVPGDGRFVLMAFDRHYRPDGSADPERTQFHVPNEYVYELAGEHPGRFVPMISVHPYRKDALTELRKWGARGVRFVKWLPNAMGIDPSDEKLDPYYRLMRELGMVLLSHIGEEQAVDADEHQPLGNPLHLRRPLDIGVRVIAAHCGSLGESTDLESPDRELVPNFDLFLRLMDEPKYEGLLFGEISGLTQYNRFDGPLQVLLERKDLHGRLVNGSDYPLPAVNIIIRTGKLADRGLITVDEADALEEIYAYNPLLFDFVLKRTVRHPGLGTGFPAAVFDSPFGSD